MRIERIRDLGGVIGLTRLRVELEYLKGKELLKIERTVLRRDVMRTMALGHLRLYHGTEPMDDQELKRRVDTHVEHGSAVATLVRVGSSPVPTGVLPHLVRECTDRPEIDPALDEFLHGSSAPRPVRDEAPGGGTLRERFEVDNVCQ